MFSLDFKFNFNSPEAHSSRLLVKVFKLLLVPIMAFSYPLSPLLVKLLQFGVHLMGT